MKNIVIVDDQYTTRLILSEIIKGIDTGPIKSVQVEAFASVNESFDWLKSNSADLFIIDYMMEDMTGYEMLQKLKRDDKYAKTPIIAMSADDDVTVKYQFLEDGATDFLVKPIDYQECKLKCKNLLGL
jgi:two-component system response regulator RpfG